ncbi:hypothetical protein [Mycolicibacterium sp.]|uniref:hypothetical protein n=1 Tax=Mycolicibacterium sp. TaxID=2320850 RepID=UPI0037C5342B
MTKRVAATIAAAAFAAVSLCLADTADAAPAGPQTADQVIGQLHSQGYQVLVNRIGAAPLEDCRVNDVRPGRTFSRTDSGAPGAGSSLVTTVTDRTVVVDVAC